MFVDFGIVLGTWAAHVPTVKAAIGASTTLMGAVLIVLGIGALTGMYLSGRIIDRVGSGVLAAVGAAAMAITIAPPLLISSAYVVTACVFVLGMSIGVSEVGMNAAAVNVERDYGRPIMASFHGMFSVGSLLGAAISAAAFAIDIPLATVVIIVLTIGLIATAAATPPLRRIGPTPAPTAETADTEQPTAPDRHALDWRVIVFGVLAFLLLLTEGSAMDWSSLHTQQHLEGSPSAGAIALGCFVAAMTVGRFTVDRVAAVSGPVRVVRYGSLLGVLGLIVVTTAPTPQVAFLGWMLLGLGLSGCVPQVFTAAGNHKTGSAQTLSRVVGAGYLAILAGPAVVGWLADLITLNGAMLLPLAALILCAAAASALAPQTPPCASACDGPGRRI